MSFLTIKLPKEFREKLKKVQDHFQAARGRRPSNTDCVIEILHGFCEDLDAGKLTQYDLAGEEGGRP